MSLYARRLAYTIVMCSVKNLDLANPVARCSVTLALRSVAAGSAPGTSLKAIPSSSPGHGKSGLGGSSPMVSLAN